MATVNPLTRCSRSGEAVLFFTGGSGEKQSHSTFGIITEGNEENKGLTHRSVSEGFVSFVVFCEKQAG